MCDTVFESEVSLDTLLGGLTVRGLTRKRVGKEKEEVRKKKQKKKKTEEINPAFCLLETGNLPYWVFSTQTCTWISLLSRRPCFCVTDWTIPDTTFFCLQ